MRTNTFELGRECKAEATNIKKLLGELKPDSLNKESLESILSVLEAPWPGDQFKNQESDYLKSIISLKHKAIHLSGTREDSDAWRLKVKELREAAFAAKAKMTASM